MRAPPRTSSVVPAIALAFAASLWATAAQARDPVGAEALFRAGRDALQRKDFAAACSAFEASQRLDPAAGTALNLAACERGRGRVASAWQHLREALDLLPADDDRVPIAKKQIASLQPRLPHLTVRLAADAPAGTKVLRDDVEIAGALIGFAQPIDPGRHVIRVTAPHFTEQTYEVIVTEGIARQIEVEPGAYVAESRTVERPGMTGRRKAGLILGGFGLTAIGIGAVEGIVVAQRGSERRAICPNDVCDNTTSLAQARNVDSSGNALSLVSTVAFAVGGAALALGTYLAVTGSPEKRPSVALVPLASPSGGGLGLHGSF
ncbi:MAG TPA: hypothetical protein VGI39_06535 [Polyangiaceae bacterium]